MFTEPNLTPEPPLSPKLTKMVNDSVARFTEKLGVFQYTSQAKTWIEDYRIEVTSVARAAFEAGKK